MHVGICIGTTNITITPYRVGQEEAPTTSSLPNPRFLSGEPYSYCQDPWAIEEAVYNLLKGVKGRVTSITVTGQVHGILYYDKEGRALSPLYTWLDQRGVEKVEVITTQQLLYNESGCHLPAGYGLLTHYANRRMGKVPARAVGFCGILEYISGRLIGHPLEASDPSTLATYGGWDVVGQNYNRNLLKVVLGGDSPQFLSVAPPFSIAGYTPEGVAVAYPVGDNQAGFLGMVDGWSLAALVNVGTSGQISFYSEGEKGHPSLELRPFFEKGFLHVGATLTAGKTYETLQKFVKGILYSGGLHLTDDEVYRLMGGAARGIGESPLRVDPRLTGSRLEALARGSIENITLDNFNLGNLVLATVDGIIRELLDYTFFEVEKFVATGSTFIKNELFTTSLERQSGKEVVVARLDDGAGFGAALIGALATEELSLERLKEVIGG